jgi:hypothetical protein
MGMKDTSDQHSKSGDQSWKEKQIFQPPDREDSIYSFLSFPQWAVTNGNPGS